LDLTTNAKECAEFRRHHAPETVPQTTCRATHNTRMGGQGVKCLNCGSGELMNSDGGLFCRNCWQLAEETPKPPASSLRAPQTREAEPPEQSAIDSEKALVRAITRALTRRGWRVCHVGQFVAKGSGTTVGFPDLCCIKPATAPYPAIIKLIEVKHGRNQPTLEQQAFYEMGAAAIVWSVADALEYCGEV
jgi:hypothetical protein